MAALLSELLKDDSEKNNTKLSYNKGLVYRVKLYETDGIVLLNGYKSRDKFCVIIGHHKNGDAIGAIIINSKINSNVNISPELKIQHYPLRKDKYSSFLSKNSHAQCNDIFRIPYDRLLAENYLGIIDDDDLELIIENMTNKNSSVPPKKLKQYNIIK